MDRVLSRYLKRDKDKISGWFARCDAQIFGAILSCQVYKRIEGAIVEIGVHHGKSFLPLALSNNGKNCYAIDIFENQDQNIDDSGRGSRDCFLENLLNFGIEQDNVVIDHRLSTEVKSDDILSTVGKVRFFHIDGGHHLEAVRHDLRLAEETLLEDGVVAVDDVFRPEWPEVTIGVFSYLREGNSNLVPFAVGFNKTYFCKKAAIKFYQALISDRFKCF